MKKIVFFILLLLCSIRAFSGERECTTNCYQGTALNSSGLYTHFDKFPKYPISHGVSAPFAGIINDWMIVAGGCNFPDVPAAKGGRKVYYSEIYAINMKEYSKCWKLLGRLPQNMAYGATVVIEDEIYFIGGENENGKLNSVYKVSLDCKTCKVDIETLPSIPECITNLSGTAIGNDIYITGGITETDKNSMYRISTLLPGK